MRYRVEVVVDTRGPLAEEKSPETLRRWLGRNVGGDIWIGPGVSGTLSWGELREESPVYGADDQIVDSQAASIETARQREAERMI